MKTSKVKNSPKPTIVKHSLEKRAMARKYYLMGLTMAEVGKLIDCSPRTIEKWKITEQWAKLKDVPNLESRVIELYEGGYTYAEIIDLMKISKPTIWRILKAANKLKKYS